MPNHPQALADAIGKHRGDVPHARDLLPGTDMSRDAAPSNAAPAEKQSTGKATDAGMTVPVQRDAPIPYPEKFLGLSL